MVIYPVSIGWGRSSSPWTMGIPATWSSCCPLGRGFSPQAPIPLPGSPSANTSQSNPPVRAQPNNITVGHFYGGTNDDLVFSNLLAHKATILKGHGDGTFEFG